jgi:hypothetical protein
MDETDHTDRPDRDALAAYARAAAALIAMPIPAEREQLVLAVVERLRGFAADVGAFALADHVEPAGTFEP